MSTFAYFDRFDILRAHYLFLSHYHEGQGSEKYAKLCNLTSYFKPSPLLTFDTMGENAQAIYQNLVYKEEEGV